MTRLHFVAPASAVPQGGPRLVSVLSGKGGVGKSILAFNLAERLAALGLRVLAVDGDVYGGNLHILANRACAVGIGEFIDRRLSLAECRTPLAERLDLLGVSPRLCDPEAWSAGTVGSMLKRLRAEGAAYDVIVCDHSSGRSRIATLIAHGSEINLLVVVPELTSISDCYGLFKHIRQARADIACRLVINRAADAEEAQYLHQKFGAVTERFLGEGLRCLGFVPEDAAVRTAVAAQQPLAAAAEHSLAVQALTRMARSLVRELTPEGADRCGLFTLADDKVNPAEADIRK